MTDAASRDVFTDLVIGSISGAAGQFCGHPLDTIKVRLMKDSRGIYRNSVDCLVKTVRSEGFNGIWKGLVPPMISVGCYQAVAFASFSTALPMFTSKPEENASIWSLFGAGCLSGLATVIVTTPTDLVKIRLQLDTGTSASKRKYKGTLDCLRSIYSVEGFRGLYRGALVTSWRDTVSTGLYFAVYHIAKRTLCEYIDSDSVVELISGGLSGMVAWGSVGPLDGIKTRVQAGPKTGTASLSMISVARDIHAEGGTRKLFRGAGPMVARAFVANAVIFSVYEEAWRQHTKK
eukprot:g4323.t1